MNICYLMIYLISDQLRKYKTHIYAMINIYSDENGRILNIVTLPITPL